MINSVHSEQGSDSAVQYFLACSGLSLQNHKTKRKVKEQVVIITHSLSYNSLLNNLPIIDFWYKVSLCLLLKDCIIPGAQKLGTHFLSHSACVCHVVLFFPHSSLSFQESPVMILIRTIQMEIIFSQSKHYVYEPFISCNILTCRLPRLLLSPPSTGCEDHHQPGPFWELRLTKVALFLFFQHLEMSWRLRLPREGVHILSFWQMQVWFINSLF